MNDDQCSKKLAKRAYVLFIIEYSRLKSLLSHHFWLKCEFLCTFVQNKYVKIYGRFFRAAAAHDRA